MKTRQIYTALLTAAAVMFPACEEKPATPPAEPTNTEEPAAQPESVAPAQPGVDDIVAAITPALSAYPWLTPGEVNMEVSPEQDGSLKITAYIKLTTTEPLYALQAAPAEFNEERKAINQSANAAMQPDSLYLLQIGAPTEVITDDNRKARPLPANLQQMVDELRTLAESSLYAVTVQVGTTFEISATMKATANGDSWNISDLALQTEALPTTDSATPESALPQDAARLTPEFAEARKNELRTRIAAFNEAAAPYIQGREEEARALWTEHKARQEEEARKAAEVASTAAAEKEQWINHCVAAMSGEKVFSGEWTRDNRFGEISLKISKAEKFENSVQFYGIIYDTKLPEAKLNIFGRCEFTKNENGGSKVDVTIYEGFYDPDQPTAEVFDAQDGILQLTLDGSGKLSGIMSCSSWKDQPERAFNISMTPVAPQGN